MTSLQCRKLPTSNSNFCAIHQSQGPSPLTPPPYANLTGAADSPYPHPAQRTRTRNATPHAAAPDQSHCISTTPTGTRSPNNSYCIEHQPAVRPPAARFPHSGSAPLPTTYISRATSTTGLPIRATAVAASSRGGSAGCTAEEHVREVVGGIPPRRMASEPVEGVGERVERVGERVERERRAASVVSG